MKKILIATALTLMCGSAFAQGSTGPAPQGDTMNKPGMNTMDKGSMNQGTTGMSQQPSAAGDESSEPSTQPVRTSSRAP